MSLNSYCYICKNFHLKEELKIVSIFSNKIGGSTKRFVQLLRSDQNKCLPHCQNSKEEYFKLFEKFHRQTASISAKEDEQINRLFFNKPNWTAEQMWNETKKYE